MNVTEQVKEILDTARNGMIEKADELHSDLIENMIEYVSNIKYGNKAVEISPQILNKLLNYSLDRLGTIERKNF